MSASKEQLQMWLDDLAAGAKIWIDDGGLALIAEYKTEKGLAESYYEIGGNSGECGVDGCDSDDEIQSTYCGSFCQEHLLTHCEECEVCAKDFA